MHATYLILIMFFMYSVTRETYKANRPLTLRVLATWANSPFMKSPNPFVLCKIKPLFMNSFNHSTTPTVNDFDMLKCEYCYLSHKETVSR